MSGSESEVDDPIEKVSSGMPESQLKINVPSESVLSIAGNADVLLRVFDDFRVVFKWFGTPILLSAISSFSMC